MAVWRLDVGGAERLASGRVDEGPRWLLPQGASIDAILAGPAEALDAIAGAVGDEPAPAHPTVLPPVESQDIWACGVTYRRSRDARMEESGDPDHYDRVYDAERPELFFKASAARTRGPGDTIGIRADSTWNAPEPELGLVVNAGGRIVGYVVGNDVSSRSIEGENPLYLPQAKSYTGSCALGPCLVPLSEAPSPGDMTIELEIRRDGDVAYADRVAVSELKRTPEELVDWLFRALEFPVGVVLLTGTGLIPPSSFSLEAKDEVTITIDGVGRMRNVVEVVGRA